MAYRGTTSTAQNIPGLVTQGIAWASSDVTGSTWTYHSPRVWQYGTTDLLSLVSSTGYFGPEGYKLGMRAGDTMWVFTGGSTVAILSCTISGATGVTWSSGTVI